MEASAEGADRLIMFDSKITEQHYLDVQKKWACGNFSFNNIMTSSIRAGWQYIFFKEINIKELDWLPQSPDWNPIEHLWTILDEKIPIELRKNFQIFLEKMQVEWRATSQNIFRNLTQSMLNRLKEAILILHFILSWRNIGLV